MSGEKDYQIDYEQQRRRRHEEQLRSIQRQRAQAVQARLQQRRKAAREQLAKLLAQRAAAIEAEWQQHRRETLEPIDASQQRDVDPPAESCGLPAETADREASDSEQQPLRETTASGMQDLLAWQNELAQDEAVQQYERSEVGDWQQTATDLLAAHSLGAPLLELRDRVNAACERARQLHDQASRHQAQAVTRNELLRDVMSALNEIGFFVADPHYEDPANPAGPVLIRATRGDENVTTSIDLSETVRSMWGGIAGEHCKTDFFDYVDKMKKRGVVITPLRPDVKPLRLEKGKKDLPFRHAKEEGN